MKQTIRFSTFETNSSSAHSLICISKDTFEKWKAHELFLNDWRLWSDNVTDKDFTKDFTCTYEQYQNEVIRYAYDDNYFWDRESLERELLKEGLDPYDFDNWDKNPYPEELDGMIKIEVFGRDG